jgi:hypothetical protein
MDLPEFVVASLQRRLHISQKSCHFVVIERTSSFVLMHRPHETAGGAGANHTLEMHND